MSNANYATHINSSKALKLASTLPTQDRQQLAIKALAGVSTITKLADDAGTSRKFIYAQKQKAETALEKCFAEEKEDEKVLFYLPITKAWLKQFVIALILICHSSYQGVIEIFRDLLDCSISKGNIHTMMRGVLGKASQINRSQDFSKGRVRGPW